jgi:hypothetical protein
MVLYGGLAIAFGVGVWASADGKPALRVVGASLVAKEVFGILATTVAPMLVLSLFGILAGMDIPRIGENLPTPWLGAWERINIYATMLWIAVLAVTVRARASSPPTRPTGR